MKKSDLLNRLNAIWYHVDTEDENKKSCVAQKDAMSIIASNTSNFTTESEFWDLISEESGALETENLFYAENTDEAYKKAEFASMKPKELSANAFINADSRELEEDLFVSFAQQIAISLGVNIDDDAVNPDYWDQAFQDELTPLEAASELLY